MILQHRRQHAHIRNLVVLHEKPHFFDREVFEEGDIPDVVVDVRTGSGMYGRRSNTAYLKLQMSFFARLREIGFINTMQYLRAVLERSAATFMPNRLVKAVYNRLLRVNARNA